ncbi:hypothetical protein Ahy_A04g017669 [Arachis hypogaea]|uniref:Uncharacterized protein n=1 Tax=Arachis hypogaea TaxID=3818 RepID=A0A445DBT1_ARAHY|nr:hypothetical protein Ahy_A04g017669 [Arachis hypogaea]
MDGGSSDNFIHPALVRHLAVPVHHSPRFKVEVGNSALLQCEGEVRDLPIFIQDHLLLISAFVLPIASEELVLGDIWLETLDTHLVNYREKFITFIVGAEMVTLQVSATDSPLWKDLVRVKQTFKQNVSFSVGDQIVTDVVDSEQTEMTVKDAGLGTHVNVVSVKSIWS